MTQYEMTEKLSDKCNVTLAEARDALETGEWNMLTATHLLDQEKFRRMQALDEVASSCEAMAAQVAPDEAAADAQAAADGTAAAQAISDKKAESARRAAASKHSLGRALRKLGHLIRRLVACGNRNRFMVQRGDATVMQLPVTALVLFIVCAFWVCVPLLVIGLFADCRYSFSGRELGREGINGALDKAANAAAHMKQTVAQA